MGWCWVPQPTVQQDILEHSGLYIDYSDHTEHQTNDDRMGNLFPAQRTIAMEPGQPHNRQNQQPPGIMFTASLLLFTGCVVVCDKKAPAALKHPVAS